MSSYTQFGTDKTLNLQRINVQCRPTTEVSVVLVFVNVVKLSVSRLSEIDNTSIPGQTPKGT